MSFHPNYIRARLASCWSKATLLVQSGYRFEDMSHMSVVPGIQVIAVFKPNEVIPAYTIQTGFTVESANGCNCPDYIKHAVDGPTFCKHTLAWEDLQLTNAMLEQFEREQANAETSDGCDPYSRY